MVDKPGLRDIQSTNRRELWLEWEGKLLLYGWCHACALSRVAGDSVWHPEIPFGGLI